MTLAEPSPAPRPRDDRREALRARWLAQIPPRYSPWLHLAMPSAVGVACVAAAAAIVREPGLDDALFVALTWGFANALEWRAHKSLLHHRVRGFELLFDRHTPHHHGLFPGDDMAVRSRQEWRFVLLPPWGVLLILAITAPIAAALAWVSTDYAALFVATSAVYVVSYEWLHLAYHLPPDGFVGRLPPIRWLRHHHATHHRPELMQKWNFNVTLPLWDLLRGTWYTGD
jgi:hypothetical protein